MDTWTLEIPIPVLNPFLWLGLLAIVIWAVAWLTTNWPYAELRKKLPVLHPRPMTNAFVWFALAWSPVWLALLVMTVGSTFSLWNSGPPTGEGAEIAYRTHYLALVGLMTALAGLVSAPLAIHRLYTVERQTAAAEEGLITDRINKAVEGLGAEKSVQRIGRPVSILEGKPTTSSSWIDAGKEYKAPNRSMILSIEKSKTELDTSSGEVVTVDKYEVRTWPKKRTAIEWREESLSVAETDDVEKEGDWQVFSQTVPNLEVRIGAIHSLERIAQDSLRDHIQIMEILCAYIRENAKAADDKEMLSEPPVWFEGKDNKGRMWARCDDGKPGVFDDWEKELRKQIITFKPRGDIQAALAVIGRRSRRQKELEWSEWRPFEEFVLPWPSWSANADGTASAEYLSAVTAYEADLENWRAAQPRYRLDLRNTDLRGADMSGAADGADFSLARFDGAVLSGSDFSKARIQGANFGSALARGTNFQRSHVQGALFLNVQAQAANFIGAQVQGALFLGSQLQIAIFEDAMAQGANFMNSLAQRSRFTSAKAQGAVFSSAQVWHAQFSDAQIQGANFASARAQGADFMGAQAQGANFMGAQVQDANFMLVQAQGATFMSADAQGANFSLAQFGGKLGVMAANFHLTAVKGCDFSGIALKAEQIDSAFGDASTKFDPGLKRPTHWPDWEIPRHGTTDFFAEWKKWQADKLNYSPPPKPD